MIVVKKIKECDTCNGFCCKCFIMPIKIHPKFIDDYKKWLSYHNVKVIFHKGRNLVVIPIKCKYLLDNGKCKVFNSSKRPIMCNIAGCPKEDKELVSKLEK